MWCQRGRKHLWLGRAFLETFQKRNKKNFMSARNGLNDFHQIGNHVQNKIIHLTSNLCEAVDIHVEDIFFESKKIVFYSKLFRLRAYFIPLPTLEVDRFFFTPLFSTKCLENCFSLLHHSARWKSCRGKMKRAKLVERTLSPWLREEKCCRAWFEMSLKCLCDFLLGSREGFINSFFGYFLLAKPQKP